MKKTIPLLLLLLVTSTTPIKANFYICRNDDCAMYVIEDDEGFSWHIECMDHTYATGRVDGASYNGNCKKMEI